MSDQKVKLANILYAPIISEKSSNAADQNNQFVFKVQKQRLSCKSKSG